MESGTVRVAVRHRVHSSQGAGSRLLRATKAQLLRGSCTHSTTSSASLSPRQRKLLGEAGANESSRPSQEPRRDRKKVMTSNIPDATPQPTIRLAGALPSDDGSALEVSAPRDGGFGTARVERNERVLMPNSPQPRQTGGTTDRQIAHSVPSPRKRKAKTQSAQQLRRSASLDHKLQGYEKSRAQLDELSAATGVRKDCISDAIVVQVGEKCQAYCHDDGAWVSGTVVDTNSDGQVCVQWEVSAPQSSSNLLCAPHEDHDKFTPPQTRKCWVLQTSSEFRRAGSSDHIEDTTDQPLENKVNASPTTNKSKTKLQIEQETRQKILTEPEKKRARQALVRGPGQRTAAQIKALVAWMWTADIFHGLTEKERKILAKEADFEVTPAHGQVMEVGEAVSAIHVVIKGECAIYTMRSMPGTAASSNAAQAASKLPSMPEETDLKSKFQSMQRRASISVREGSFAGPTTGEMAEIVTKKQRRPSVAMGLITEAIDAEPAQHDTAHSEQALSYRTAMATTPNQTRRKSFALRRDSIAVAPANMNSPTKGPVDATMFPVQMVFAEGDALGVERAIHNNSPEMVQSHGYRYADHTVMALSQVISMVFTKPEHTRIIERAYHNNLNQKVDLLSTVSSYAQYPAECLRSMAKFCRRLWYKNGDCIVKEGDQAEHVLYISLGQCRVVKDLGGAAERTLSVLRRGACVGDWGVVNNQLRLASCVAVGDVEVLSIAKFNFTATIDQVLLSNLLQTTQEKTKQDEADTNSDSTKARANALRRAPSPIAEEGQPRGQTFQLITRADVQKAVAQMH